MNHPSHVALSELSIDPANVRKAGRGAEPEFAESIKVKGIIDPLVVRPNGKGFLVTNGSKRFDALLFLKKKGEKANGTVIDDSYQVPVTVRDEDEAAARETSLMANIHSPMHPVDRFEAFAQLIQDGATVDDIAKRYVMKVPEVRQALSLAAIAPEIRKAWREGKIDGEAAEAYAQTQDLQHQVRIFTKLKSRAGDAWAINNEVVGANQRDVSQLLKFVGQEAYEAAGHHVNHSLFDDDERNPIAIDNVPALKAMAAKKLEDECERLKKEGWGWAILRDAAPSDIHAWRRLPAGTPTKDMKALAGCTVRIGPWNGNLEVERGYIKPGTSVKITKTPAQKAAAKKAQKTKDETGGISGGLAHRLSKAITLAAADALAADSALALRVVIAAMACDGSPAKIDITGMAELNESEDRYENEFPKYFALTGKKDTKELLAMLATWAARSLNMSCHSASSLPFTGEHGADEGEPILLNALSAKAFNEALRKRFDFKDYFDSVSKQLCLDAMAEAFPNITVNKTLPKGKIAEIATANISKSKWLPVELRSAHYDGPAKPSKPAAKKRR